MAYSLSSITTIADCDALLAMANKERDSLTFRKLSLQRQQVSYSGSAVEVEAELQAVTTELNTLNVIIPTLPEGDFKQENVEKQLKLQWRQQVLTNKKADYGVVALLDKEYDIARADRDLLETDEFITALNGRKAEL